MVDWLRTVPFISAAVASAVVSRVSRVSVGWTPNLISAASELPLLAVMQYWPALIESKRKRPSWPVTASAATFLGAKFRTCL